MSDGCPAGQEQREKTSNLQNTQNTHERCCHSNHHPSASFTFSRLSFFLAVLCYLKLHASHYNSAHNCCCISFHASIWYFEQHKDRSTERGEGLEPTPGVPRAPRFGGGSARTCGAAVVQLSLRGSLMVDLARDCSPRPRGGPCGSAPCCCFHPPPRGP